MQHVRPYSSKTTLVELDSLVVSSAQAHWSDINGFAGTHANEEIIIDDAKHYLMTTNEKFDLIIMDISSPYYLGTMLLHNREFFRLVRARLKYDGVFSESTQSRPRPSAYESTALRILRAVDDVFPYWNIIATSGYPRGNHGYVYAYRHDMTSSKTFIHYLKQDGYRQGSKVYSNYARLYKLQKVKPFSLTNMDSLLTSNYWRIKQRLQLDEKITPTERHARLLQLSNKNFSIPEKFNSAIGSAIFWVMVVALISLAWWLIRPKVNKKEGKKDCLDARLVY